MRDTCATGFVKPKTTALFFDKLYIPKKVIASSFGQQSEYDKIPKDILFDIDKDMDDLFSGKFYSVCQQNTGIAVNLNETTLLSFISSFVGIDVDLSDDGIDVDLSEKPINTTSKRRLINYSANCGKFLLSIFRNRFIIMVANEIEHMFYINVVPIFFDKTDFEKSLDKNLVTEDCKLENPEELKHYNFYEALITCDQMIDESKLSWEQVLEIRKDKIEQAKLKRFRLWANSDFDNCSKEQIIDIIGSTYNDYVAALQKHGIKTLSGSFATVLTEAAIGMLSAWGGNTINYVGLGLQLAVGTVPLGRAVKDYVKLRKEPIAYYYDIKKRLK